MSNFVGKFVLNSLINVKVADIEMDGQMEKCVLIPIRPNDIIMWEDEIQLWFRAFAYREPKSRFTHFLMKFIPKSSIKKMSAAQIEAFANHKIGGMIKDKHVTTETEEVVDTADFIKDNI